MRFYYLFCVRIGAAKTYSKPTVPGRVVSSCLAFTTYWFNMFPLFTSYLFLKYRVVAHRLMVTHATGSTVVVVSVQSYRYSRDIHREVCGVCRLKQNHITFQSARLQLTSPCLIHESQSRDGFYIAHVERARLCLAASLTCEISRSKRSNHATD